MRTCLAALILAALVATAAAQEPVDSAVARFYDGRWQQPAWVRSNALSPDAASLVTALGDAAREGLDASLYLTPTLDTLLHQHLAAADAWRLDSLLTHLFFSYARDVSRGRVDPASVDTQWTEARQAGDLVARLERVLDRGTVRTLLRSLPPPQPGYDALRAALARYREIARGGDWPAGFARRLAAEGYDTTAGVDSAVRAFQTLHGLTPDGVVGPVTAAALAVPATVRANQIALNLERWRWLPRQLGARYLMVNSAAFTLTLVEDDSVVWTTRAITGRTDWPTPLVSGRATHLLFRPRWKVPRVIAARELLPSIQRDTAFLARERFRVFSDSARGGKELDPHSIAWTALTESTFTYQLVQESGGDNPLGGVKLVFWNPFSVYIHDTPTPPLFEKRLRTFSHGCVRIEHAAELVGRLLPDWPPDSIRTAMSHGGERWVRLPQAIPVYLSYWTAWVTDSGLVAFAADPYGWDLELERALHAAQPVPIVIKEGTSP